MGSLYFRYPLFDHGEDRNIEEEAIKAVGKGGRLMLTGEYDFGGLSAKVERADQEKKGGSPRTLVQKYCPGIEAVRSPTLKREG